MARDKTTQVRAGCGQCSNGLRLIIGVFDRGQGQPPVSLQCWFRCPCSAGGGGSFAVDNPGPAMEAKAPKWRDEMDMEHCAWTLLGTWVQRVNGELPPYEYQIPDSPRGQRHWYGADAPLPEPWVASKGNRDISQAVREIGERMHPT